MSATVKTGIVWSEGNELFDVKAGLRHWYNFAVAVIYLHVEGALSGLSRRVVGRYVALKVSVVYAVGKRKSKLLITNNANMAVDSAEI